MTLIFSTISIYHYVHFFFPINVNHMREKSIKKNNTKILQCHSNYFYLYIFWYLFVFSIYFLCRVYCLHSTKHDSGKYTFVTFVGLAGLKEKCYQIKLTKIPYRLTYNISLFIPIYSLSLLTLTLYLHYIIRIEEEKEEEEEEEGKEEEELLRVGKVRVWLTDSLTD